MQLVVNIRHLCHIHKKHAADYVNTSTISCLLTLCIDNNRCTEATTLHKVAFHQKCLNFLWWWRPSVSLHTGQPNTLLQAIIVTTFQFINTHIIAVSHYKEEVLPQIWTSGWTAAWRPGAGCAGAATARSSAPSPLWGAATWWFAWCGRQSRPAPSGRHDAPS